MAWIKQSRRPAWPRGKHSPMSKCHSRQWTWIQAHETHLDTNSDFKMISTPFPGPILQTRKKFTRITKSLRLNTKSESNEARGAWSHMRNGNEVRKGKGLPDSSICRDMLVKMRSVLRVVVVRRGVSVNVVCSCCVLPFNLSSSFCNGCSCVWISVSQLTLFSLLRFGSSFSICLCRLSHSLCGLHCSRSFCFGTVVSGFVFAFLEYRLHAAFWCWYVSYSFMENCT